MKTETKSLLDEPQRLGVLPTLWFWSKGWTFKESLPSIVAVTTVTTITTTLVVFAMAVAFGISMSLWQATPVGFTVAFFAFGMIERIVRAGALRRRRELSALVGEPLHVGSGEPPALREPR